MSPSGKNPYSESWKRKKPVPSLDHEKRQIGRLALEKQGFHFLHFTFSQDHIKGPISLVAELWVLTIIWKNSNSLVSCPYSTGKHRSYSLFLSLHCCNFMDCPTFLKQKFKIAGSKEKVLNPKLGCLTPAWEILFKNLVYGLWNKGTWRSPKKKKTCINKFILKRYF